MQQIERYGVIALVFLLVTIVAVSFWGDGKSPGFWSRLTGRGEKRTPVAAHAPSWSSPASTTERAVERDLPLSQSSANESAPAASTWGGAPAIVADASAPAAASSAPSAWNAAPPSSVQPMTSFETPSASPTFPPAFQGAPQPAPSKIAAVQTPLPERTTRASEYVVQKGDSFRRIAAKTLGNADRWREIQAVNAGVDPRSLRVGTKLALPGSSKVHDSKPSASVAGSAKKPAARAPSSAAAGGTYVVRAGDTLESIAARNLGDESRWREIAAANPGVKPQRLLVGKTLRLPARAGTGAPTTVAAKPAVSAAPLLAAARPASDRPRVR